MNSISVLFQLYLDISTSYEVLNILYCFFGMGIQNFNVTVLDIHFLC